MGAERARPYRVGVALLSTDLVLEREIHLAMPATVATYVTRVPYPETVTEETLSVATDNLVGALAQLSGIRPELAIWACTSGSFFRGPAHNEVLERMMSLALGVPAVTASSAVRDALLSLGASRVAVLTPYSPDINARLEAFLTASGLAVVSMRKLYDDTTMSDFELQSIDQQTIKAAVRDADDGTADTILVSCTGVPLVDVVAELETEVGKPIVGSNLALMRAMLRAAGVPGLSPRYGRLLAETVA